MQSSAAVGRTDTVDYRPRTVAWVTTPTGSPPLSTFDTNLNLNRLLFTNH